METKRRICRQCETYKPLEEFTRLSVGRRRICKDCETGIRKEDEEGPKYQCDNCGQLRPRSQFGMLPRNRIYPICRTCINRDPEYIKKRVNNYLKSRYNITYEIYEQMLKDCNYQCPICNYEHKEVPEKFARKRGRLAVDHDHTTGKVRGLLCHQCNKAIGLFRESPEVLKKAIVYLKRHGRGSEPYLPS